MDLHLNDKVVVVTGGASGIGEAIVRLFAEEGAIPVILDRNAEAGEALTRELTASGRRAGFRAVELTQEDDLRAAIDAVLAEHGRLDGIVNNASVNDGVGLTGSPSEFAASLQRNLVHAFALVHGAVDALTKSSGFVVNISSKVAVTGQGGTSGYAAAKGGLNALTREWAVALAPAGIRVNAVIPAEVMTPQYESWLAGLKNPDEVVAAVEAGIPLGHRMTTPEEIAAATVFLASDRSSHTTGQLVHVDGGYVHLDRAFGKISPES